MVFLLWIPVHRQESRNRSDGETEMSFGGKTKMKSDGESEMKSDEEMKTGSAGKWERRK